MSGEKPWLEAGFPLKADEYIEYLYQVCHKALQKGLLPHLNVGVLAIDQLFRLKPVCVSMGLMLETTNDSLTAHNQPSGKRAQDRLDHIERAGQLGIPFTTGILLGIGESGQDRRDSLLAIKDLNDRYGHIQEIIIQNFKPKPGTPMANWPEPDKAVLLETVKLARDLMPEMSIQIPPNLNPEFEPLLRAGANDIGGISPEKDEINPEIPWQTIEELTNSVHKAGYYLLERLPVYPEIDADIRPAADTLRRELVGDEVSYVVNCNVNFTNICTGSCTFCAFHRRADQPDAFILPLDQMLDKIQHAVVFGATEVCIQGGLHPEFELKDYLAILKAVKNRFPDIHIHAFSPMEVWWAAGGNKNRVKDVLIALKDNGLGSMPGTAAEILVDEVRAKLCPTKLNTEEWSFVIASAHKAGIRTTSTIMFGHIENWQHRIRHLEVIRNIQLDTGGFTEFVLLPFLPGDTPLARRYKIKPVDTKEVLKLTAYARLFFGPDLPNIQNSWVKLGVETVQESLSWGANDFGGTLMEESISRSAGAQYGQLMTVEEIKTAIAAAGRKPVERDTLYNRHERLTSVSD